MYACGCVCIQHPSVQRQRGSQDATALETNRRYLRPRAGGETHGARPEKTEALEGRRSGGDSEWVSADVKYLGQLETKTESRRRRCPQERTRYGKWRQGAVPFLIGTWPRIGGQAFARNDSKGATSIHALQYSRYDRSYQVRTGRDRNGQEQSRAQRYRAGRDEGRLPDLVLLV